MKNLKRTSLMAVLATMCNESHKPLDSRIRIRPRFRFLSTNLGPMSFTRLCKTFRSAVSEIDRQRAFRMRIYVRIQHSKRFVVVKEDRREVHRSGTSYYKSTGVT